MEALLLTHPDISDAAVIGIPDQVAGELPKAFVVRNRLSLTESEILKFVEGWFEYAGLYILDARRNEGDYFFSYTGQVSNYKRLRGGVQFMETIPKSPSGKILRRELRKLPVRASRF